MVERKPSRSLAPASHRKLSQDPLPPKLFVLDTNVLMHDPTSLFRFEEHDIYLPILTLEELDNNKKGMSEVARNARQASRFLDELVTAAMPATASPRASRSTRKSGGAATGRLFLQTEAITTALPPSLASGKADNQIIAVVMHLQQAHPKRNVILVSQGHQHAHQGARAGHRRRGLLQRQGARGHRPPLHRHARAAGRFLGPPRQGRWNRGSRAATPTTASPARSCRRCSSTSSSTWRSPARRRSTRMVKEVTAAPRCCRRSRTTRTRRTTSGASPRATASRTSRSTC